MSSLEISWFISPFRIFTKTYFMKISFQTIEESNRLQEAEFLALSPAERFFRFLWLSRRVKQFPTKAKEEENGNFVIEKKSN